MDNSDLPDWPRMPHHRERGAGRRYHGAGAIVVVAVVVARLADVLPEGPAVAQVVQICHKGADRAGAPEENR
ncbi:hypothetical protein AM609_12080 [Actinomyces sp. oral taxon 414]|nr:hypothetical protein AM609_12080 [Actinomyces sp. oral taxon 414]